MTRVEVYLLLAESIFSHNFTVMAVHDILLTSEVTATVTVHINTNCFL